MMAESKGKKKPSVARPYIMATLVVVILALASAYAGYVLGARSVEQKYKPDIRTGSEISVAESSSIDEESPVVMRCIELCKSARSIGIPVDRGACISASTAELNGFVCAVVVSDKGHCAAYYRGSPEIVLTPACEFVGVYQKEG